MKKAEVLKIFVPAAVLGLAAIVLCILMSGCFLYGPTSKKLTTYYSQSKVVSARFFTGARNGDTETEELEGPKVQELVEKLDSMALKTKAAHTDYFWAGQYGIELSYEDGTFLVYDGTKLFYRKVSVTEGFRSEDHLKSEFMEVTNMSFWEEMKSFFPKAGTIF
ncbi:MAG: hypothetical protein IJM50_06730 [Lachnospiraceae bacterium]|nr:hypothetical protein [Lachnospiraceae bacterium]